MTMTSFKLRLTFGKIEFGTGIETLINTYK